MSEEVPQPEKPRKPGTFAPGPDPRRGAPIQDQLEGKKKPRKPYQPPKEDGAPERLQLMRHVFLNEKAHDTTTAQEHLREILKTKPELFMREMNSLEAEHEAREREKETREAGVVEETEDEGTDRAIRLCEEWLKEHGVQDE